MQRHPHIVNREEIEWTRDGNGERFEFRRKWFTPATGAGEGRLRIRTGSAVDYYDGE